MTTANTFEEAAAAIQQCEQDLQAAMKALHGKLAGTRIHIANVEMVTEEVWTTLNGQSTLGMTVEVSIETEFRNGK